MMIPPMIWFAVGIVLYSTSEITMVTTGRKSIIRFDSSTPILLIANIFKK